METAIVPGIYDPALADEDVRVETEAAWDMLHRVAREEGLFVGVSGAAALVAAIRVAAASSAASSSPSSRTAAIAISDACCWGATIRFVAPSPARST